MQYCGGKFYQAKGISEVLNRYIAAGSGVYWEPFIGMASVAMRIKANSIHASDLDPYVIAYWQALQRGWLPPPRVLSKEEWLHVKNNKDDYPPEFVCYVGRSHSFGGTWFSSYMFDKIGRRLDPIDGAGVAFRSTLKDSKSIRNTPISFSLRSYESITPSKDDVVYCDPPYENTGGGWKFNHLEFWDWCQRLANEGVYVFVSEYKDPPYNINYTTVWSKDCNSFVAKNKAGKRTIEKLHLIRPQSERIRS